MTGCCNLFRVQQHRVLYNALSEPGIGAGGGIEPTMDGEDTLNVDSVGAAVPAAGQAPDKQSHRVQFNI